MLEEGAAFCEFGRGNPDLDLDLVWVTKKRITPVTAEVTPAINNTSPAMSHFVPCW